MDLSIIIVNWNSAAYLRKCLASVYANTKNLQFEVIVIDNASYDGCQEMLRSEFPAVKFIQSEENLGFARANNRAFRESRGRHILFLNPDTEVIGAALEKLIRFLDATPDAGIVGCKLLNSDLTLQTSCIQAFPTILNQLLDAEILRRWLPRSRLWGMQPLFDDAAAAARVDAVSGACLLIRRALFESCAGFNTAYFMYSEDVDLCFQSRRAGWKNFYLRDAVVIHHGGRSSDTKLESSFSAIVFRESKRRFFVQHRGLTYAVLYGLTTAVAALARMAVLALAAAFSFGDEARKRRLQSLSKWARIFRWSLGLEGWARGLGQSPEGMSQRAALTGL
jgi:N-acetylglucosaminyl-diphospho-decaprenol L-rhamnosyltransferase